MNSIQELAQWVIDNRYPKSENEKTSDVEMYNTIFDTFQNLNQKSELKIEELPTIINKIGDCIDKEVENDGSLEQISDVIKLLRNITDDNWMFVIQ